MRKIFLFLAVLCLAFPLAAFADSVDFMETVRVPAEKFSVGKYEVTQKQFETIMGFNPSCFRGENLPVENVSVEDAIEFCKKLTERERNAGKISQGMKYALPTSKQWSVACGKGLQAGRVDEKFEQMLSTTAWYYGNSGNKNLIGRSWDAELADLNRCRTHPVGQKVANNCGAHDILGNVWEWCVDDSVAIARGGSAWNDARNCDINSIWRYVPQKDSFIGFRVILVSKKSRASAWSPDDRKADAESRTIRERQQGSSLGEDAATSSSSSTTRISPRIAQSFSPWRTLIELVKIPNQDWRIGKYEVTQKQYEMIMGTNPSYNKGDNLPVEQVSQTDAKIFCEKLTDQERKSERIPSTMKYALPTTQQWEYACMMGGVLLGTNKSATFLNLIAWYGENSKNRTHQVGTKKPNNLEIYDMIGNVWEWCAEDGTRRGGSFYNFHSSFSSSTWHARKDNSASFKYKDIGFRVVLVPVEDGENENTSSSGGRRSSSSSRSREGVSAFGIRNDN